MISERNTQSAASWGQHQSVRGVALAGVPVMTSLRRLWGEGDGIEEPLTFAAVREPLWYSYGNKKSPLNYIFGFYSTKVCMYSNDKQISTLITYTNLLILFIQSRCALKRASREWKRLRERSQNTNQRDKNYNLIFDAKHNTSLKLTNSTTHPRHRGQSPI